MKGPLFLAKLVFAEKKVKVDYLVGTMIELPRACLTADEIAGVAEFFSFGTNDLTQTTFGLSRDDAGKFLPDYVRREILPADPFEKLDQAGVGKLVAMGVHPDQLMGQMRFVLGKHSTAAEVERLLYHLRALVERHRALIPDMRA